MKNKPCGCLNKMAEGGSVPQDSLTPLGRLLATLPSLLRGKMNQDAAGQDTDEYDARLQQAVRAGRFTPVSGGRRDPELNGSSNVSPLQVARGWAAGTLGLPGDLEGLLRGVNNLMTPEGSSYRRMDEHSALPTSEFYQEWLPGRDESAAGRFAGGLGNLAGGFGSGAVARTVQKGVAPVAKSALATIEAGMRGQGPLRHVGAPRAPAYAMKPKGGNFKLGPPEFWDEGGGNGGWIPENLDKNNPIYQWQAKNLRNYITRDLGTATDPMLDVEREFPGMHLPEGGLPTQDDIDLIYQWRRGEVGYPRGANGVNRVVDTAIKHLDKHDELSGNAPLTPWGRLSDSQITEGTAGKDLAIEMSQKWPIGQGCPDAVYADAPGLQAMQDLRDHTNMMISRMDAPRLLKKRDLFDRLPPEARGRARYGLARQEAW